MAADRITQLRLSGMRVIDDITLDLHPMTVLIGDNGAGKSTIPEALELLREAAGHGQFVNDVVVRRHGGLRSLMRSGVKDLKLGVTIEGAEFKSKYDCTLGLVGREPLVVEEHLKAVDAKGAETPVLWRASNEAWGYGRPAGVTTPLRQRIDVEETE